MVDRSDSRHLVLCSAGGGLWGSIDAGATWAPLTDRQPTLVMGAIAQSASSPAIVYAATGDGDGASRTASACCGPPMAAPHGTLHRGALTGVGSYDVAIDPSDPLRVWIATDRALHFSANGGDTARTAIAAMCWSVRSTRLTPAR